MKRILFILVLCFLAGSGYSEITWSSPAVISTALTDATDPQVVIDADGNATSIWIENGLIKASVQPVSSSWSSPVTISNALETSSNPKLKLDSTGNATAMWIGDGVVQTATLVLSGSWVSGGSVSGSGASSLSFDVDSSDNAVAVWVRSGFVESSTRQSGTWSLVSVLSAANSDNPHVAISNIGKAMAAWHSVVSGSDVIVTDLLTVGTNTWAATKNVFPTTATFKHNYPKVAIDASGNSTIAWFRYNLIDGNAFTNVSVIASSLPAGAASWGMGTILTSGGIRDPQDLIIKLRYDQNGDTIALWTNSYDGESFSLESSTQIFGGSWQTFVTLQVPTIYSFSMDLAVASTAALMTNMAWDEVSAITIQSQETDVANPFSIHWTNNNVYSSGDDNAYPKCALSFSAGTYNAASVWINYDGVNTVIYAVTGSGPQVEAPSDVDATQDVTHFGVFDDYFNTVTWTASSDPNIIQYNIYRNGVLFTSTDPGTLEVVDHNQGQGETVTYGVAALTSEFNQSPVATFTLFP